MPLYILTIFTQILILLFLQKNVNNFYANIILLFLQKINFINSRDETITWYLEICKCTSEIKYLENKQDSKMVNVLNSFANESFKRK